VDYKPQKISFVGGKNKQGKKEKPVGVGNRGQEKAKRQGKAGQDLS